MIKNTMALFCFLLGTTLFAKDISTKYIDPPNTTDFAIMFLPIEGLYAEILKEQGLLDRLRDKYNIFMQKE